MEEDMGKEENEEDVLLTKMMKIGSLLSNLKWSAVIVKSLSIL